MSLTADLSINDGEQEYSVTVPTDGSVGTLDADNDELVVTEQEMIDGFAAVYPDLTEGDLLTYRGFAYSD